MSDRSERNNAGLPGLSRVPGVGELFKHRNDKSRKTELVILMRPILAKTDSVWQREIAAASKRINDMQGPSARGQIGRGSDWERGLHKGVDSGVAESLKKKK